MTDYSKVKESLEKNGFKVQIFATGTEAVAYLKDSITGTTVGFGGSKTLDAIGLFDALSENNQVIWHWKVADYENLTPDQTEEFAKIHKARMQAMNTEVYICSANALAETGEIVNIDGAGNRLASTLWGHKRVFFVIGSNKLVPTYEDAVWRARNVAAPKRARSMHKKTPCATGDLKCHNCNSPQRICRGMATIWQPLMKQDYEVILIDEEYGM